MMRWQCYVVTTMGYELVQDDFPMRFDRNAVTKAFEGRYGMKVIQVNPIGQNQTITAFYPSQMPLEGASKSSPVYFILQFII